MQCHVMRLAAPSLRPPPPLGAYRWPAVRPRPMVNSALSACLLYVQELAHSVPHDANAVVGGGDNTGGAAAAASAVFTAVVAAAVGRMMRAVASWGHPVRGLRVIGGQWRVMRGSTLSSAAHYPSLHLCGWRCQQR